MRFCLLFQVFRPQGGAGAGDGVKGVLPGLQPAGGQGGPGQPQIAGGQPQGDAAAQGDLRSTGIVTAFTAGRSASWARMAP